MCRACRARGIPYVARDPSLAVVTGPLEDGPCAVAMEADLLCGFVGVGDLASSAACASASDVAGGARPTRRVVVGAGVAGTCCVEELCRLRPDDAVTLVTLGDAVKSVRNVERVTRTLEVFDVVERPSTALAYPNLTVVRAAATGIDPVAKTLFVSDANPDANPDDAASDPANLRRTIPYDQLCVCSGAEPRSVPGGSSDADVAAARRVTITVRDVDSVQRLRARLHTARRVLVAGNGGIAMELVGALVSDVSDAKTNPEPARRRCLVWATRHASIGDSFFDRDAAAFLLRVATRGEAEEENDIPEAHSLEKKSLRRGTRKRRRVAEADEAEAEAVFSNRGEGAAAGPDWTRRLLPRVRASNVDPEAAPVRASNAGKGSRDGFRLVLRRDSELARVSAGDDDWPAYATLTNGERFGVDVVVAAAGVDPAPRIDWLPEGSFPRARDGGVAVNETFRCVSDESVFAAGDVASTSRDDDPRTQWFQMRLWAQARTSGTYVARVMTGDADAEALGFNYEIFTHTTRFFGLKVILLGLYNGQKLEHEPESDVVMYTRSEMEPEPSFVRVLLLRGRMVGAVLVGETELEETFENLILDGVDLSRFGPELLDPELDIADYFD